MSKFTKKLIMAISPIVLLIPVTALAVDYGGVGGRPASPRPDNPRTKSIFVYEIKPSGQIQDGITVFNDTAQPKTVAIESVDSVISSDGGFACAQAVDQKKDLGGWIQISQKQVALGPKESVTVPFTVAVPKKADIGEHDGCITIQDVSANAAAQKSNGVVLGFRSALRTIVTIPGA
ncbi:MAG TPA: DUF916 domain-containing protein, partial [Candidatus Polarisedimenticolaceae bacterium]|nr:DUF916 domain-containing protein [Candidatus Polarisedimenticolaceae bacterium]